MQTQDTLLSARKRAAGFSPLVESGPVPIETIQIAALDAPVGADASVTAQGAAAVPRTGAARSMAEGMLIAFVTAAFVAGCVAAGIGMWYLVGRFANEAYKAVAAFLILIVISNIASKYLAWCIGKLS